MVLIASIFVALCTLSTSFAWMEVRSSSSSSSSPNAKLAQRADASWSRRSYLQTVLLPSLLIFSTPLAAPAAERPMWLTDPTEEFNENERKAMDFRRNQLAIKQKFTAALERISAESNDETALRTDVEELQRLVAQTRGLPLGIKKQDMFKQIRAKKAKGFWPTSVEVA